MTKYRSCLNQKLQLSSRSSSTMRRLALPAAAMSSSSPVPCLGSGPGIFCTWVHPPMAGSWGSRSLSLPPGQPSTFQPLKTPPSFDSSAANSASSTPTSASGSARGIASPSLAELLLRWPLEEVIACPTCGMKSCWCTNTGAVCISPICDPHGSGFLQLDGWFGQQGSWPGDRNDE